MDYVLIVIFDETMKHVLLMEKNRGPFPNCWNCPGGKVEANEHFIHAARRELKEETGLCHNGLVYLLTMIFPDDTRLAVYCTKLNPDEQFEQIEDEPLMWFDVTNLKDVTNTKLAGDGNLPFFINLAKKRLGG